MATAKTFTATLERMPGRLGWTIARVPGTVSKAFGRGMAKVRGDVNGFEFRTSLFPDGKGVHYILVNKQMQKGAAVVAGARAKFRLEADTEERAIKVPPELAKVLARSKRMEKLYGSLNHSIRKWIADMVAAGKAPATRGRKAEQIAEWLLETMAAEKDLPPTIARALAANPKARHGWERMTASMRRGQLMGVFYYRSVEARARRLAKALAAAEEYAERKGAE